MFAGIINNLAKENFEMKFSLKEDNKQMIKEGEGFLVRFIILFLLAISSIILFLLPEGRPRLIHS